MNKPTSRAPLLSMGGGGGARAGINLLFNFSWCFWQIWPHCQFFLEEARERLEDRNQGREEAELRTNTTLLPDEVGEAQVRQDQVEGEAAK